MQRHHVTFFLSGLILCSGCDKDGRTDPDPTAAIERRYNEYRRSFADTPAVSVVQLLEMMAKRNVVLIDVRTEEEQAVSMIKDALTVAEFEHHRDHYRTGTIVTYCTIGYRSGLYAKELRRLDFDAHNLEGSILTWIHAGQPVVDEAGKKTNRVHVYGPSWNLVPKGYKAVW